MRGPVIVLTLSERMSSSSELHSYDTGGSNDDGSNDGRVMMVVVVVVVAVVVVVLAVIVLAHEFVERAALLRHRWWC